MGVNWNVLIDCLDVLPRNNAARAAIVVQNQKFAVDLHTVLYFRACSKSW